MFEKLRAAGITAVAVVLIGTLLISQIRIVGGMSPDLPVQVCEEIHTFYAPWCLQPCPSGNPLVEMPVSTAFDAGHQADERCLAEGWFSEYEVSLLTELLDYLGIWKVHQTPTSSAGI